jgi:HEPN domain-containing protein
MPEPSEAGRAAAAQWAYKAEADWIAAEQLWTTELSRVTEIVGFHAQQCVEKYLKALLALHQIDFPWKHDLGPLIELLREAGLLPGAIDADALEDLTPYAVELRYPGDIGEITREEATHAVALAREVRRTIQHALGTEHRSD